MKFFSRERELPKKIRKTLVPDREFVEKAKDRFLTAYDAHQTSRNGGREGAVIAVAGTGGYRAIVAKSLFRLAIALVVIAGVATATSVFADTANVPPTSPLYPFKRLAENVQLAFTSNAKKPALELSFAARRIREIDLLEASSFSASSGIASSSASFEGMAHVGARRSPLIRSLTRDLGNNISSSLSSVERAKLFGANGAASLAAQCGAQASSTGQGAASSSVPSSGYEEGHGATDIARQLIAHPEYLQCLTQDETSLKQPSPVPASTSIQSPSEGRGNDHGLRSDNP